jgi:hypothetical protein
MVPSVLIVMPRMVATIMIISPSQARNSGQSDQHQQTRSHAKEITSHGKLLAHKRFIHLSHQLNAGDEETCRALRGKGWPFAGAGC